MENGKIMKKSRQPRTIIPVVNKSAAGRHKRLPKEAVKGGYYSIGRSKYY